MEDNHQDIRHERLRAHHLSYLIEFCIGDFEYPVQEVRATYGPRAALYLKKLHDDAKRNPAGFEILLVRGFDEVCDICEAWMKPKCARGKPFLYGDIEIDNLKEDEAIIRANGWQVDREYRLEKLILDYRPEMQPEF